MHISLHTPQWDTNQYELIDSGEGYKLERFGTNILIRPEPQAIWRATLSEQQWGDMASASFHRGASKDGEKGSWSMKSGASEQWWIQRKMAYGTLKLRMGLTSFKHVGVFAEQATNWDFIQQRIAALGSCKLLNMFSYTGGASIAAALAGAEVTHLDSVKAVNIWARENAEVSGITSIRYITDDALDFARRELRRGNSYDAIVLDPPAYGRGTDGQKWVLEENIYEMLSLCEELLSQKSGSFLLLSLYSMGFSALLAHTLVSQIFGSRVEIDFSELYLQDSYQKNLPLGLSIRVTRL